MINPGEHVCIFGMSGCGKSTLTRQIASTIPRKIIFDRLSEWSDLADYTLVADSFESFAALYKNVFEFSEFTIIVRPKSGLSIDALKDLSDEIFALAYRIEQQSFPHCQGLAIVLEEAWLYAPISGPPAWIVETLLTGRHYKISLISNAQRPALMAKMFISQSRHVFIGQFFEARDKMYYRESIGEIALSLNPPQKFEFFWYRPGGEIIPVHITP